MGNFLVVPTFVARWLRLQRRQRS